MVDQIQLLENFLCFISRQCRVSHFHLLCWFLFPSFLVFLLKSQRFSLWPSCFNLLLITFSPTYQCMLSSPNFLFLAQNSFLSYLYVWLLTKTPSSLFHISVNNRAVLSSGQAKNIGVNFSLSPQACTLLESLLKCHLIESLPDHQ